jgi:PPOX class probable F420-dependent enzyme
MAVLLSNEIRALLDSPNFAHLATLMPDGSPQSVPIWVGREDDRILICTGEGSLKAKNTRRDPRVSLSIVDFHDPYKEAQLRGRVVERRPAGDCKYIGPISVKYTGKLPISHPRRESGARDRDREGAIHKAPLWTYAAEAVMQEQVCQLSAAQF